MTSKPESPVILNDDFLEEALFSRVTLDMGQARIVVADLTSMCGEAAGLFGVVAKAGINVDLVVHGAAGAEAGTIALTVPERDRVAAVAAIAGFVGRTGGGQIAAHERVGKISVVGLGLKTHGGIAAALFDALARSGINIEMIATSEQVVSVIVSAAQAEAAFAAACREFEFPDESEEWRRAGP